MTEPADVSLRGAADARHLLHAVENDLMLLTRNHDNFEDIHLLIQASYGVHEGILAILFDNGPRYEIRRNLASTSGN